MQTNLQEQSPLVVDLDGTLVSTDTLHELVLSFIQRSPFLIFKLLIWLIKGRAHLKYKLYCNTNFSFDLLPYNNKFLDWLKSQRLGGRKLVLCTGANQNIAEAIASNLCIFDEVFGSNESVNLTGKNKAIFLKNYFGISKFDYAGNSYSDLYVWEVARKKILVNASFGLEFFSFHKFDFEIIFRTKNFTFKNLFHSIRIHQWMKNLLQKFLKRIYLPFLEPVDPVQSTITTKWQEL
jgi:phosphoserine phosphatase